MRDWAKEILVRYYIGAIVVAMLIVEALNSVAHALTFAIPFVAQNWGRTRMSQNDFSQYRFLIAQVGSMMISAVLLALAAYLLAIWLFGAPPEPEPLPSDDIDEAQDAN